MVNEEQERVAEELRRVRDAVREAASGERDPGEVLPATRPVPTPAPVPKEPLPSPAPAPPPPDATAVNAFWNAEPVAVPPGLKGFLFRALRRLLAPAFEAQVAFNSRQVRLDNEALAYIDARFAETHRHYDRILGITGRHLGEIDERHLILQEELVTHVHDLVKRIDVVLAESDRGRLALEFALEDLRARLERLEGARRRG